MFKVGDWVKITPTADNKWSRWNNNQDIYAEFAGKIGKITDIIEDYDDANAKLIAVTVDFKDGFMYAPAGEYYEYFKSDHLIRSSEYEAQLQYNQYQAGIKLQEWEDFKRKTTDDMLKYIFGRDKENKENDKQKSIEAATNETKQTASEWDLKTDPVWNTYDD